MLVSWIGHQRTQNIVVHRGINAHLAKFGFHSHEQDTRGIDHRIDFPKIERLQQTKDFRNTRFSIDSLQHLIEIGYAEDKPHRLIVYVTEKGKVWRSEEHTS